MTKRSKDYVDGYKDAVDAALGIAMQAVADETCPCGTCKQARLIRDKISELKPE